MSDMKFADSHEWISVDDEGVGTVGISEHAQELLGDIVFVELPETGAEFSAKQEAAVVESVKAASDIYSPVSGEIVAVNEALLDAPETINSGPMDAGWIFKIKLSDPSELDALMDADTYTEHCQ